jgi:hypothetical protein
VHAARLWDGRRGGRVVVRVRGDGVGW